MKQLLSAALLFTLALFNNTLFSQPLEWQSRGIGGGGAAAGSSTTGAGAGVTTTGSSFLQALRASMIPAAINNFFVTDMVFSRILLRLIGKLRYFQFLIRINMIGIFQDVLVRIENSMVFARLAIMILGNLRQGVAFFHHIDRVFRPGDRRGTLHAAGDS